MSDATTDRTPGPVAWMARNGVAANLLMIALLVGGGLFGLQVKQEVFPEFELDIVTVRVPYPGASPAEVETGIVLAVEEAVRGIDGVKRVEATSSEDIASVTIELEIGVNKNKVATDIRNAVDRIASLPQDAERPVISVASSRREVVTLVLYGEESELVLRALAEKVRDTLLVEPGITQVDLSGVRPLEIAIEVPQDELRRYGLTLEQIAARVRRASVELPGGSVKTRHGEVLLRTAERRDLGTEFAALALLTTADGTRVRLGDIAGIRDGFQDTDESAFYDGRPGVMIKVFRTGSQGPLEVSSAVRNVLERIKPTLPPGIEVSIWEDNSEIYRERIDLLLKNAALGLLLVLFILGLFLEIRLAFWVTLGIPISFLGSALLLPVLDVSINMISLFAYIVTLGMVVDDAIVVGENIYEARLEGRDPLRAAIDGAREVAVPVTFSILTTIAAFMPMFFIPGFSGKLFRVIPSIVVSVLVISLVESLFVLPAHLAHTSREQSLPVRALNNLSSVFGRMMQFVIDAIYTPFLRVALAWRYVSLATGIAILVVTLGFIASGRLDFTFMPKIESDKVTADLTMPFGVSVEETKKVQALLVRKARALIEERGGDRICRGIFTQVGKLARRAHVGGRQGTGVGHLAHVQIALVGSDQRDFSAASLASAWRDAVGELPGVEALTFDAETGPSAGKPVHVQLSHRDVRVLEQAASELAALLREYPGVRDIDDGYSEGKPQIDFRIRPEAESLGISATDLGRQVRSSFYGIEAVRQQRGRDEVRVMVRLPEQERRSEYNVEALMLRTPTGGEVPLREAATVERGASFTEIKRVDGRRVLDVTADVEQGVTSGFKIKGALSSGPLEELCLKYPGLSAAFEGENKRQAESIEALRIGMMFALIVIYGLLAIPFGSYVQPVIVMSAIPFGIVGAVIGHVLLGYTLSVISMMGIVALTGVVVNDSLVLIDAANGFRARGMSAFEAINRAGRRRFRPIWLTSLTTFFGLTPMIFETSLQARFLIPMAISLGFGVLFSTFVILLLVPVLYLVVEDGLWLLVNPIEPPESGEAGESGESSAPNTVETVTPTTPESSPGDVTSAEAPASRSEAAGASDAKATAEPEPQPAPRSEPGPASGSDSAEPVDGAGDDPGETLPRRWTHRTDT